MFDVEDVDGSRGCDMDELTFAELGSPIVWTFLLAVLEIERGLRRESVDRVRANRGRERVSIDSSQKSRHAFLVVLCYIHFGTHLLHI